MGRVLQFSNTPVECVDLSAGCVGIVLSHSVGTRSRWCVVCGTAGKGRWCFLHEISLN